MKRKSEASASKSKGKKKPAARKKPWNISAMTGASILCIQSRSLPKEPPAPGHLVGKGEGKEPREKVLAEHRKSITALEELGNWRRTLSRDFNNTFLRPHVHNPRCGGEATASECKRVYDSFWSIDHAFWHRAYATSSAFRFLFTLESDSQICRCAKSATDAAIKGSFSRKVTDLEQTERRLVSPNQPVPKGRNLVETSIRPQGVVRDPGFTEDAAVLFLEQLVLDLCRQNENFHKCLVATHPAVLYDGKTQLFYLTNARDKIVSGKAVIKYQTLSEPEADQRKPPALFPVQVITPELIAVFPAGVLSQTDIDELRYNKDVAIPRLRRAHPERFFAFGEAAKRLIIADLGHGQAALTLGLF